jgi:hypothetical protein
MKYIRTSDYGITGNGSVDTNAWMSIFTELKNSNGGAIEMDYAGKSVCRSPWIIPKTAGPIAIIGKGKEVSKVEFNAFIGDPCIQTEEGQGDLIGFHMEKMSARHTGDNPVFRHTSGRFKDSKIVDVYFAQSTPGTSKTIEITGGLSSKLIDVSLNGGHNQGTGIDIRGTQVTLSGITTREKSTCPSIFMKLRLINSLVTNCRTEGGNALASYWVHDGSSDIVLDRISAEGDLENAVIRIEDSTNIKISGNIGVQDLANSTGNIGIEFINSTDCMISGVKMSARPMNICFDAESHDNRIEDLSVIKSNFENEKNDVFDLGKNNLYSKVLDSPGISNGLRSYKLITEIVHR